MIQRTFLAALCLALATAAAAEPADPSAAPPPAAVQAPAGVPLTLRILSADDKSIGDADRKRYEAAKSKAENAQVQQMLSSLRQIVGTTSNIVGLLLASGVIGALLAVLIARRRSRHWLQRAREFR